MFHPVGSQPPSVYWRRRLFIVGTLVLLVVLIVLTVNAVGSTGGGRANAGSPTTSSSTASSSTGATPSVTRTSTPPSSPRSSSSSPAGSSGAGSSTGGRAPVSVTTPAAADCVASNLQLRAVSGAASYRVGDSPLLQLQVTNIGALPCVQDLADKQIELRVYNGESRVWGSHDCKILPGVTDRTLAPKSPVVVSIKWSGLTSKAGACAPSSRQRVGAGTYTLYASLAGHQAPAGQFTIS